MEAEKILKEIESVDPLDYPALDRIDKMVCEYLGKIPKPVSKYTRSRDILKNIRPDSLMVTITAINTTDYSKCHATYYDCLGNGFDFESPEQDKVGSFPEELSELHVIIQAIEHERK